MKAMVNHLVFTSMEDQKVRFLCLRNMYQKGTEIGDEIEVFVYLDQEERPIATTEEPLAQVVILLIWSVRGSMSMVHFSLGV